jgi:hypothetical protein
MRWLPATVAIVGLGAMCLATAACQRQPGTNAYGRYQSKSNSSDAVYDRLMSSDKDDWFKDRGY